MSALLTDFGRTANLTGSADERAKAEEQNSAATRAQILLAVDQAFYNTLEAQALMRVAQETQQSRGLVAKKVAAMTNAKLKSDLDLSFAMLDFSRARLQLLEARTACRVRWPPLQPCWVIPIFSNLIWSRMRLRSPSRRPRSAR